MVTSGPTLKGLISLRKLHTRDNFCHKPVILSVCLWPRGRNTAETHRSTQIAYWIRVWHGALGLQYCGLNHSTTVCGLAFKSCVFIAGLLRIVTDLVFWHATKSQYQHWHAYYRHARTADNWIIHDMRNWAKICSRVKSILDVSELCLLFVYADVYRFIMKVAY